MLARLPLTRTFSQSPLGAYHWTRNQPFVAPQVPQEAGAAQFRVSFAFPGVTVTLCGAVGAFGSTGVPLPLTQGPLPAAFFARTRTWCSTPLVRPVIVWERTGGSASVRGSSFQESVGSLVDCTS